MNKNDAQKWSLEVFEDQETLVGTVADRICLTVQSSQKNNDSCVLSLAAGATPLSIYKELARRRIDEGFSFEHCVIFGLDEYFPISPNDPHSFYRYLHRIAFLLGIPDENVHLPRGDVPRSEIAAHCEQYEQMIKEAGGIDFLLLGIGRSGHIGFNEPGSLLQQRTRLVSLHEVTRQDAAHVFGTIDDVPQDAITVGIATVFDAREVVLIAFGEHKAPIVKELVEGLSSPEVPASFLLSHKNVFIFVDSKAASMLSGQPGASRVI